MKLGELVSYKIEPWEQLSSHCVTKEWGVGLVTWWDGHGKCRVLWSKKGLVVPHDDWELVPHANRRPDKVPV